MRLVREIMHCKPGKVRPMVEKLVAMSALGYHDLVEFGRREIYRFEN